MSRVLFAIVPVLAAVIIVFSFVLLLSPKARGKFMSRQLKATKYMMDESKEDIRVISEDYAEATRGGVEMTARAVKKGFSDCSEVYCKYCGRRIDEDSIFCKFCGGEQ